MLRKGRKYSQIQPLIRIQCWGSVLKKVMYYTLHIALKNSNALHYMITPWRK